MRRLLHILTSAATVLSLMLCAGTVGAWVRSYRHRDGIGRFDGRTDYQVISQYSTLSFFATPQYPTVMAWGWHHTYGLADFPGAGDVWGDFFFEHDYGFNIGLPYWLICLVTVLPGASRLVASRVRRSRGLRSRRLAESLCPNCGYDCRATPDRCPECGRVPAVRTTARHMRD